MRSIHRAIVLAATVSLAGCGRPSDGAVAGAIGRAWQQDTIAMEIDTGLLTAENARGMQGVRSSTKAAIGAIGAYAGGTVAQAAGDAVGVITEFAGDIGGKDVSPTARQGALMTARDWRVANLEILNARESGSDYVLQVRYDVAATIAGREQSVGRDLTETIRLERRDGAWAVAPVQR